jgi:hypothetical protein
MVWRPAAVEALAGFLGNDAELLPLRCEDADLKLLNVWRTLASDQIRRQSLIEKSPVVLRVDFRSELSDYLQGGLPRCVQGRPFVFPHEVQLRKCQPLL